MASGWFTIAPWRWTPRKMKKSSLATSAIFTRQAERPKHGFEKAVSPYFLVRANLPVFFRGGKRESKQVGRSGNHTSAHAHAKKSACEETRGSMPGGGQLLRNLICEPCTSPIRLHLGLKLVRKLRPEQTRGEVNSSVQHALRTYRFRRIRNALPSDTGLARN